MAKKTKQRPVSVAKAEPKQSESKQPAPELLAQVQSIRALATCYNLLQKGMFTHGYAEVITQSLNFLQALHAQASAAAMSHPDAALVPELQSVQQNKGG